MVTVEVQTIIKKKFKMKTKFLRFVLLITIEIFRYLPNLLFSYLL